MINKTSIALGLIPLIFMMVCLSGCNLRRELNELAIATSMGIDESNEGMEITFQIISPGGKTAKSGDQEAGKSPVYPFSVKGKSIIDILQRSKNLLHRELFFSDLTFIAIGEKFAQTQGLRPVTDFVERQHELRKTVQFFVAKHASAKEVLMIKSPLEQNTGTEMLKKADISSGFMGMKRGIEIDDITRWHYGGKGDFVGMGVAMVQTDGKKDHVLTGFPLFKENKLAGWFTSEQTRGWVFIRHFFAKSMLMQTACQEKNGFIGVTLSQISSRVTPVITGNQIKFNIYVKANGMLEEVTCPIKVEDPNVNKQMEHELEYEIKNEIASAIKKAQNIKADVFGFGDILNQHYPKEWLKRKTDWETIIPELSAQINVNIRLITSGKVSKSIHEK